MTDMAVAELGDSESQGPNPSAPGSVSSPPSDKFSFSLAVDACVEALGHRPAGVVTDVDGTIAPIVLDPSQAAVLPAVARLWLHWRGKWSSSASSPDASP